MIFVNFCSGILYFFCCRCGNSNFARREKCNRCGTGITTSINTPSQLISVHISYPHRCNFCTIDFLPRNIVHLCFIQRLPWLLQEGRSCHLQGEWSWVALSLVKSWQKRAKAYSVLMIGSVKRQLIFHFLCHLWTECLIMSWISHNINSHVVDSQSFMSAKCYVVGQNGCKKITAFHYLIW